MSQTKLFLSVIFAGAVTLANAREYAPQSIGPAELTSNPQVSRQRHSNLRGSLRKTESPTKRINRAPDDGRRYRTVLEEDFSLMTSGTPDDPDRTIINTTQNTIPDKYTHEPGWSGRGIMQAGGAVAISDAVYDSFTQQYMTGQIETPYLDLHRNNGTVYVSLRVKSIGQPLDAVNIFWQNSEYTVGETQYAFISNEWRTLEFTLEKCTEETSIVIYADQTPIAIDDIKIEQFHPEVEAPTALKWTEFTADSFVANWSEVENADHYILNCFTIYGKNTEEGALEYWSYKVKNLELKETSYKVTGLDPTRIYYYYVVAVNEAGVKSEDSQLVEVVDLLAPTGVITENISAKGFHSLWDPVINAEAYTLQSVVKHTAPRDETYYLIQENFDNVGYPAGATEDNPGYSVIGLDYLDDMLSRSGWTLYEGGFAPGMLAIHNRKYSTSDDLYEGELISPMYGVTNADGLTITFSADFKSKTGRKPYIQLGQAYAMSGNSIKYALADSKWLEAGTDEWQNQSVTLKINQELPKVIRLSILTDGDGLDTDGDLLIDNLKLSVNLKEGKTQSLEHRYYELTDLSELKQYVLTDDAVKGDHYSYQLNAVREHPSSSWMFKRYVFSPWTESQDVDFDDYADISGISIVEACESPLSAESAAGVIMIHNPACEKVTIATLNGVVAAETSSAEATVTVAPGLYIVKGENNVFKLVVK